MPTTKQSEKELAQKVMDNLPPDSTLEEIIRELYIHYCALEGQKDVDAGRTITQEEMAKRVEKWFG